MLWLIALSVPFVAKGCVRFVSKRFSSVMPSRDHLGMLELMQETTERSR
jgi:hypothetical protein